MSDDEDRILDAVRAIPEGFVRTYGDIRRGKIDLDKARLPDG